MPRLATAHFLLLTLLAPLTNGEALGQPVTPVPTDVRADLELDGFYQKYLNVGGLPVVGSANVSDAAIREAGWIVRQMLGHRNDILNAMADNKTRLAVMAWNEFTSDIPEHRHLEPRVFWDRRARGLGATPSAPAVSCAEENLLGHPNDPYSTENICIHEFAHAIHAMGLPDVDPTFDERLKRVWTEAKATGLWTNTYAITNRDEYWAEAVQSWFDDNRENDSLHNHVNTRDELLEYDPQLAELCREVFGDGEWRYQKPLLRVAADRAHLSEVEFDNLPRFQWRKEPIPARPIVLIQTTAGDMEVELDNEKAPTVVAHFLRLVHQGRYSNGRFYTEQPEGYAVSDGLDAQFALASDDPALPADLDAPVHWPADQRTLLHRDGTISLVIDDASLLTGFFVICIGDQPLLDDTESRVIEDKSFAAFGKVTSGMDVVRDILKQRETSNATDIQIQRAVRLN